MTEAAGLPLGIAIAGANRHDVTLVEATLASIPVERPDATEDRPQGMCMDKAYDSDPVRIFLRQLGFTPHIRSRRQEAEQRGGHAGHVLWLRHETTERANLVPRGLGQRGTEGELQQLAMPLIQPGQASRIERAVSTTGSFWSSPSASTV